MKAKKMTQLNIQVGAEVRPAPVDYRPFTVTATGTQVITFDNVKTIRFLKQVSIQSTTGVRRAPSGACTFTGNTVSVVDSGIAVGEIVHVEVIGYSV